MNGQQAISTVRSFDDLDDAARIDAIMRIEDPADRERVQLSLTLETHSEVKALKAERRYLTGLAHVFTAIVAAAVGIVGQPLRP